MLKLLTSLFQRKTLPKPNRPLARYRRVALQVEGLEARSLMSTVSVIDVEPHQTTAQPTTGELTNSVTSTMIPNSALSASKSDISANFHPKTGLLKIEGGANRDLIGLWQFWGQISVEGVRIFDAGSRKFVDTVAAKHVTKIEIDGGAGDDVIRLDGVSARDPFLCLRGIQPITTTTLIFGGLGNDEIHGGAGSNVIHGGDKKNTLHHGPDNDTIYGGASADQLFGGIGNDRLYGGDGDDAMWGDFQSKPVPFYLQSVCNDRLEGGAGNDNLHGGAGNDLLFGEAGADKLWGDSGKDWLDEGASWNQWQRG